MFKHSSQVNPQKDVAKWSSDEVQHWIKHQCRKFELKKATAEKFEMNGRKTTIGIIVDHSSSCRSSVGIAYET